jgi:hypothetical protein
MWIARGNGRSEDTQEIIDQDAFFTATYNFDAWQCSLTGAEGRGKLPDLMATMRRRRPSGVVFTDGAVSFAAGVGANDKWVVYDSHPPRARKWFFDSETETVSKINDLLLCKNVFDCSIVTRKVNSRLIT